MLEEDIEKAPLSLEYGDQLTVGELKEVNLDTIEEPRPIFISSQLVDDEGREYVNLLTNIKMFLLGRIKRCQGLIQK